jgi:hypothetical protein
MVGTLPLFLDRECPRFSTFGAIDPGIMMSIGPTTACGDCALLDGDIYI